MDATMIRIKDNGVAIGIAVLSLVSFFFVYRSAQDSHELDKVREQNRLLGREIQRLENSFASIRKYTKTADQLANGMVSAAEMKQGEDLGRLTAAQQETGLFARMSLSARSGKMAMAPKADDLDSFTNMLATIDGINRDTDIVVRRLTSLAVLLKNDKKLMRSIPSISPVEGGRIASDFGLRLSPFEGKRHFHAGTDIAATEGTVVVAPADGVVTFAGDFDTLGKSIVVSHGNNMLTRYGHLSRILIRNGANVKRGQPIGHVGNTGRSTGPHLHYEVWVRNVAVNPRDFFFDLSDSSELLLSSNGKGDNIAAHGLNGMGGEE